MYTSGKKLDLTIIIEDLGATKRLVTKYKIILAPKPSIAKLLHCIYAQYA